MTKILITSVSAGAGHVRAAAAVEAYLKTTFDVQNVDLMTFSKDWFRKIYTEQYIKLVESHPQIWKLLYSLTDRPAGVLQEKLRRRVENISHAPFFEYVEKLNPEIVVSSHFMPPEILQSIREKKGLRFKIITVVTDFDVHYLWVNPWTDLYLVAGQMAYDKLVSYGIPRSKLKITGIPIMPQFFNPVQDALSLHNKWKTNNSYTKVLLMAGGGGVGDLDMVAKNLLAKSPNIQAITLAGKNMDLLSRLNNLKTNFGDRLIPMGFTSEVHELMQIADVVITKPGGLSTSECIALRKPMLLVNAIPGQEEHNAQYLSELDLAIWARDTEHLSENLELILKNLNRYQSAYNKYPHLDTQKIMRELFLSISPNGFCLKK